MLKFLIINASVSKFIACTIYQMIRITKIYCINPSVSICNLISNSSILFMFPISQVFFFLIFSNNFNGKAIAPRLSVRLKAGLVSGAISLPDTSNGFVVKKNVFSGKAFADVAINTAIKIISLNPNSYTPVLTTAIAEVVVRIGVPAAALVTFVV